MGAFSERLRKLAEEKGVSQKELAKVLGITPPTLSYYFNGREVDYTKLIKIADYFDVSTDYLVGRTDIRSSAENFQVASQNTDKLAQDINNLPQEDTRVLTDLLNNCLDAMAGIQHPDYDYDNDRRYPGYDNRIFDCFVAVLEAFLAMYNCADSASSNLQKIALGFPLDMHFEMPSVIALIKSRDKFKAPIDKIYNDFAHMVLEGIEDEDMREMIRPLLL